MQTCRAPIQAQFAAVGVGARGSCLYSRPALLRFTKQNAARPSLARHVRVTVALFGANQSAYVAQQGAGSIPSLVRGVQALQQTVWQRMLPVLMAAVAAMTAALLAPARALAEAAVAKSPSSLGSAVGKPPNYAIGVTVAVVLLFGLTITLSKKADKKTTTAQQQKAVAAPPVQSVSAARTSLEAALPYEAATGGARNMGSVALDLQDAKDNAGSTPTPSGPSLGVALGDATRSGLEAKFGSVLLDLQGGGAELEAQLREVADHAKETASAGVATRRLGELARDTAALADAVHEAAEVGPAFAKVSELGELAGAVVNRIGSVRLDLESAAPPSELPPSWPPSGMEARAAAAGALQAELGEMSQVLEKKFGSVMLDLGDQLASNKEA